MGKISYARNDLILELCDMVKFGIFLKFYQELVETILCTGLFKLLFDGLINFVEFILFSELSLSHEFFISFNLNFDLVEEGTEFLIVLSERFLLLCMVLLEQ